MKYSTSPPVSRCHSPGPFESGSNLPMPITCRYKIIFSIYDISSIILDKHKHMF